MDNYGYYTTDDAEELSRQLVKEGTISFPFSEDGLTSFVILMSKNCKILNNFLHFGGNPGGCVYVGVLFRGFFHFNFCHDNVIHVDYVAQKIGLNLSDANQITKLLNGMKKYMREMEIQDV